LVKSSGELCIARDCVAGIGNPKAHQRCLQFIAQVPEELKDDALLARAASE
jgi:hypothetical protein